MTNLGKTFVAFFAYGGANQWFMNGLRKWWRRKDAVFSYQRVGCERSGVASLSDCFDYAPGGVNYLQN
jgi:hypothetical protein